MRTRIVVNRGLYDSELLAEAREDGTFVLVGSQPDGTHIYRSGLTREELEALRDQADELLAPDPDPDPPPPPPPPEPSRSPIEMWTGPNAIAALTDEELVAWKARGVGGWVASTGHLPGMGGGKDREDSIAALEAQMPRILAAGFTVRLGCHLVNYHNTLTPLREWSDDSGWQSVATQMTAFAKRAKEMGCSGLAFDCELYTQKGGVHGATWGRSYPGAPADVEAKARQRGGEVVRALRVGFPDMDLAVYKFVFPGSLEDEWRRLRSQPANFDASKSLHKDFWRGALTEGARIEFWDADFYKGVNHPDFNSFEDAVPEAVRRFHDHFHGFDNASYTPFFWIEDGPRALQQMKDGVQVKAGDKAQTPEKVAKQLPTWRHRTARSKPLYAPKFRSQDHHYQASAQTILAEA